MSFIATTDFYLEVAKGNVPGHAIVNIAATNPEVGTTDEDVWDVGGVLLYPTANESMEFVFANSNDTAAGTGAREITLRYMDDTYVEQTPLVIASNGGTLSAGISDYFRKIEMTVTAVGSDAENEGDVTLQVTGGGAVRGQINATENESQDSHYTVPAGKTAYILGGKEDINKNEDLILRYRRTDGDNGIFRTLLRSSLYQDQFGLTLRAPSSALVEKTDLKVLCVSSNTTAEASIFLQILVVDN